MPKTKPKRLKKMQKLTKLSVKQSKRSTTIKRLSQRLHDRWFWLILLALPLLLVIRVLITNNAALPQSTISPAPQQSLRATISPTAVPFSYPLPTITPTPNLLQIGTLYCSDCMLFPVSKTQALSSTYAPTVQANNLPGGGSNTAETIQHLSELIKTAKAAGYSPVIASAYRSYQTQISTFNYWVGKEMSAGYSRQIATTRANVYSAMAGHSEHQLGTTVDIAASGCEPFDTSCKANLNFWAFLAAHAHEHGFVISYPNGKQQLTGYKSEPWHIRYLGVELATQLKNLDYLNPDNQYFPERFLLERYLTEENLTN